MTARRPLRSLRRRLDMTTALAGLVALPGAAAAQQLSVGTVTSVSHPGNNNITYSDNSTGPTPTASGGTLTTTVTTFQLVNPTTVVNWANLNVVNTAGSATNAVTQTLAFVNVSGNAGNVAVLNRVAVGAGNTTTITGNVTGTNGVEVWISNPNGILIGNNANINTNGFVATTLPISESEFNGQTGGLRLTSADPADKSSIVTSGTFNISTNGGVLAVVAPVVQIGGNGRFDASDTTGTAGVGAAAFVAATDVTMQDAGSPLSITIRRGTTLAAVPGDSSTNALDIAGTVRAGTALMVVSAQGVVDTLLNVSANVTATAAAGGNGVVILAGTSSDVPGAVTFAPNDNTAVTGSGSVALSGAIDAGAAALMLGAGGTDMAGAARAITGGGLLAAGSLSAQAGGSIALTGDNQIGVLTANAGRDITLTGNNRIDTVFALSALGAVTLRDTKALTIDGTTTGVSAGGNVAIANIADALTVSKPVKTTAGDVSLTGAGGIRLGADVTGDSGVALLGDVTLTAASTVQATGTLANIRFGGTVDGDYRLSALASGTKTFDGTIGGGTPLAALTTDQGSTLFGAGAASVSTVGGQVYDAVSFDTDMTFAGGTGSFGQITGDGHALTLSFSTPAGSGVIGTVLNGVRDVTTLLSDSGGTTTLNGFISTTGSQTYRDDVLIDAKTTLSSGGDVVFAKTVNAAQANSFIIGAGSLTVADAPSVTFDGIVGGTNRLASLDTTAARSTTFAIAAPGINPSVTTSGPQSYGPAILAQSTRLLAGTANGNGADPNAVVTFGTLNGMAGTEALVVTAAASVFGGVVGAGVPLASIAAGVTRFAIDPASGGTITTAGPQSYGAATLVQDARLVAGAGNVTFASTIDSASTARNLAVTTTGLVAVAGRVGATPLASLVVDGAGGSVSLGGDVTTTGAQAYNALTAAGPHGGQTLTSTGSGDIRFDGTVDADSYVPGSGAHLIVATGGTTTFARPVGSVSPFGAIATDDAGTTALGADVSAEMVTFRDPVTLTADSSIGGQVLFASTVGGPGGLTLASSATKTAALGLGTGAGVSPLGSLAVSGGALSSTGDIATTGGQDYQAALYLGVQTPHAAHETVLRGGSVSFSPGQSVFGAASESVALAFGGETTLYPTTFQGFVSLRVGPAGGTGGATTVLSGAYGLAGDLVFNDPVRLAGDVTATSTGGGTVAFANTVDAASAAGQALTIATGGRTVLARGVGTAVPLAALATDAGGTTEIGGDVYAASQSYGDQVSLTGAAGTVQRLDAATDLRFAAKLTGAGSDLSLTGAGTKRFGDTVDLPGALVVRGGVLTIAGGRVATAGRGTYDAVALAGPTTLASSGDTLVIAALAGGGNDLTLASPSPRSIGSTIAGVANLTTMGGGTVLTGTVTTSAAQTYGDAVTLAADAGVVSTGDAAITFASGVSAAADGARALTVTTNGRTTFAGPVGTAAVGANPLASLTTSAGPVTIGGGAVTTIGGQSYGGTVTLGTDTVLTASTLGFSGGLAGAGHDVTLTSTGAKGIVGFTGVGNLTANGGGTITLGSITTGGFQNYVDAVVLASSPTTLASGGSGAAGAITIGGTLGGAQSLSVNTAGVTTFGGTVSGLTSLATDAAGSTVIAADVTAAVQSYGDAVTLMGPSRTLTAATSLAFGGTLTGTGALTLAGDGTRRLGGAASLGSFTSAAGGVLTIAGGGVTTAGVQNYVDAVVLASSPTTLASGGSGAAGAITFGGTLGGAQSLSVNTAGVTTFGGTVSGLTSLATDAAGSTVIAADVTAAVQNYGDAVTLMGTPRVLTATTSLAFGGTLTGTGALTLAGDGTRRLGGAASLGSLTSAAGGVLTIAGGGVTTAGAQSYADAVVLGADARLVSTGSGDVAFLRTVDAASAGAQGLTVGTGGTTAFGGAVGAGARLASLTTDAGGTTQLAGDVNADAQSYGDAVTLTGTPRVLTAASSLAFGGTLTGTGALTLAGDGARRLGGAASLGSLTSAAGGVLTIAGGGVTTAGAQTYADAVVLGADTRLASNGNGGLTFAGTIDGTYLLSLRTTGAVALGGVVGATMPIGALAVRAGSFGEVAGNRVGTLAASVAGGFVHDDAAALTIGTVDGLSGIAAGSAPASVTAGGPLTLAADVAAGAVSLAGVGIVQLARTTVDAGAGTIALDGRRGAVALAGSLTTANAGAAAVRVVDAGDVALGTIATGAAGTVTLGSAGAGAITGAVTQVAGGTIATGTLTGAVGGSATLTNAGNSVATLGAFAANGLAVRDGRAGLSVVGPVDAGGGDLSLTLDAGTLALQGNLTAVAGTVALVAGGAIVQGAGSITAAALTGSSSGGASFTSASNAVGRLGPFANTGSGGFSLVDGVALIVGGDVSTAGDLRLTAPGIDFRGHALAASGAAVLTAVAGDVTGATATAGGDLTVTGAYVSIGTAQATGGALTLRATGAGGALSVGTGSAGGAATLASQGTLGVTGSLTAGGSAALTATGTATLGQVGAATTLAVAAGGIAAGSLKAGTTLMLTSGGNLTATTATAGGDLTATGAGVSIGTAQATGGALTLRATGAGGALSVGTGSAGGAATLASQGTLGVTGSLTAGGSAALTATGAATLGQVGAATTLAVTAGGIAAGSLKAGTALTLTSGGDLTATTAAAGGDLTATGAGVSIGAVQATGGALTLRATGAGGALSVGTGSAGGAATLASQGTLGVTGSLTAGGSAALTATGTATLGQVGAATTLAVTAGGIAAGSLKAGTTLTLTSGGDLMIGSGQAGGDVAVDAGGTASLGTVTAGAAAGITVRALDAAITGAQTAARVTFVNRSPATTVTRLGDGTAAGGFRLSQDEVNFVNAGALTVDAGGGDVQVGALAFGAAAGRDTVTLLTTGRIDVTGAASGGGAARLFRLGGTAAGTDDKASVIEVLATGTGGGRLLFDTANLELRGTRIGVGQAGGFLAPIGFGTAGGQSPAAVASAYVGNANSALYNATFGGAAYAVPAPTLVSARSLTVRYSDYALFQNTGAPGINAGVALGGTTAAPVANALMLIGPGGGNAFALFGTINGVSGTATALLGPLVISTGNVDLVNTRINGCLVGSGAGCLTSTVSQPTLNVFDASRLNVFRSADDLVLPFDPVVGGNNESLFSGVGQLDVPVDAVDCAANPNAACRPAGAEGARPAPTADQKGAK